MNKIVSNIWFWFAAALVLSILTPNPAIGLVVGALIGLTVGNPVSGTTGKASKKLLQLAVILLGFGIHFSVVMKVGMTSVWVTMISITLTLVIGILLGRLFLVDRNLSVLLSSGTAICGGSAIAAMSPSIGASQTDTGVAMAVVFLLNALGLVIFPPIGRYLALSQEQFGFWSALAIHDTSSVVGAAAIYGSKALAVGTTVKLTRALWILPLAIGGAKLCKSEGKAPFQWFLVGFLAAAAIRTIFPSLEQLCNYGAVAGKHMMTGTLFLIGGGLSREQLKRIGVKPLLMAVALWIIVSCVTLFAVKSGWMPELGI
jgi:uncharacterized integral membrane protein (TIGR00698 family)